MLRLKSLQINLACKTSSFKIHVALYHRRFKQNGVQNIRSVFIKVSENVWFVCNCENI